MIDTGSIVLSYVLPIFTFYDDVIR